MSSSWRVSALLLICCAVGYGCKTIAQPADTTREPAVTPAPAVTAAPEPAAPAPVPAPVQPSQPPVPVPAPAPPLAPAVAPPAAVPAPAPAPTPPPLAPTHLLQIRVGLANFRASPGTGSAILGVLRKGTRLTALEEKDRWFRVRLDDGREGWVAASVVAPAR